MGDSFTEGVGDDLPSGGLRGWADLVALGLAAEAATDASVAPFSYANLAIRGKLLRPIVEGQLEPAMDLTPDLLSLCGGGNDVMRPKVEIAGVVALLDQVVERALSQGVHVLMLTGANPTKHLPLGTLIQRRGDRLADAARSAFSQRPGVTYVDNWLDPELTGARYWSPDRLHLNALGHARVAANVLAALGAAVPPEFAGAAAPEPSSRVRTPAYYREHVLPWIGRRLSGRSSGDGRSAKRPELAPVTL
ncbi:GDSL family lipase [Cryobacterium sp. MLB-32]|uniref:SGNH/GDSL hydrolase family protein n=1 Tax=Cryobacterium sp. MLB-32 TaxID=1529318 RepID=UPI0004E6F18F|nr:SGNH/GDSL hydrolase family protein [Cryobacterium sp. MLB-32]KFF58905.1 GDSL family lipase [Cryobacterium sp. MLB-32]